MVLPAQSGPVYPPQYLPNVVESKCKVGHVVTYVRPPNREDGTPSSAEWAPTKVRLDSPRFGTALSDVGLEVGALLGQPERGPFGYLEKVDMTLPLPDRKAILRKRTAAWEELRSSNLQLVVGLRAKAVRKEEEAKLAALKKGSFGDDEPSIAQKLEAQRSAMIQASEEAIKASTVAAEKRESLCPVRRILPLPALLSGRAYRECHRIRRPAESGAGWVGAGQGHGVPAAGDRGVGGGRAGRAREEGHGTEQEGSARGSRAG